MSNIAPATAHSHCLCGCNQETSPKSYYRVGHDAAHVSVLLAELYNSIQDGRGISEQMIRTAASNLPSEPLRVKFTRAAERLTVKKTHTPRGEWVACDTDDARVGRWTYPVQVKVREDANGQTEYTAFRRNTKRDGSGEWVEFTDTSILVGR